MSGTSFADTQVASAVEQLPPEALALLDAEPSIFNSQTWWRVVLSHAMPLGAAAAFIVIRLAGRIAAVVPMLRTGATLGSLTTPYSCEYAPSFAIDLGKPGRLAAMAAFAQLCRAYGTVRLDTLPAQWDGLPDLEAGARQAGLHVLHFDHFGNWYDDVNGLDWSTYLQRRPGALRETIRRRLRQADKLQDARFDLLTQPATNGSGGRGVRIRLPP